MIPEERHANEQYFFDGPTCRRLAELLAGFARPCCLCAPLVAQALVARHRPVWLLDIDRRFASVPGFVEWNVCRPRRLDVDFDVILCDPPFFKVGLQQLFAALRMLGRYDFGRRLMISYLVRRSGALLATFARFGLRPTGVRLGYLSVQSCAKNEIELYANWDWQRENPRFTGAANG